MQPEDLRLLEDAFHRATEADPRERAAILREFERSRPSLAGLFALMLSADAPEPTPALRIEIAPPTVPAVVGPYVVGERLGEGGFGVVYLAEQSGPVPQVVAIKFIRRSSESDRVLERFQAERRALAALNHPCIPRLLDAGSAPDGRPYLVMEYVPGPPITAHCRDHSLAVEQRVRLVARVADALAHAHFRDVLHRDLKPGNVLVTRRRGWDEPKVIDFGISKIVLGDASPGDLHTSQPAGTPSAMAPEQVLGAPCDRRTDIYAIGLLLYRLIADRPAFLPGDRHDAAGEHRAQVFNSRPIPPDSSVSPAGWQCPSNLARSASKLDEIILRCLQPDPALRFDSASELADALRDCAGEDDSPESIAAALEKGHALEYAGDLPQAERVLIEVVPRSQRLLGRDHALSFRAETLLAVSIQEQDRHAEAEPRLRDVHDRQRAALGENHPDTLDTLGHLALCIAEQGRDDQAEPLLDSVYRSRCSVLGPEHDDTLAALNNLAAVHYRRGRYEQALQLFLAAADARERLLGADHLSAILPRANAASTLLKLGRTSEAEFHTRSTTERFARALGPDHPGTIIARTNLANILRVLNRFDESEAIASECAERAVAALGPSHTHTRGAIARLLHTLDDRAAADHASGAASRAAAWRARAEALGISLPVQASSRPDEPRTELSP